MTSLFIILSFFINPDSLNLYHKTELQVEFYVQNLENEDNKSLYLWGLSEVAGVNCHFNEYIALQLTSLGYNSNLVNNMCKSGNRNPDADSIFFKLWDDDKIDHYKTIVSEKKPITQEKLAFEDSPLIHFKLLMSTDASIYYSQDYLESALDYWIDLQNNGTQMNTFESSILNSLIIVSAFLIDKYGIVKKYSDAFLSDQFLPNSIHKLRLLGAIDFAFYVHGDYDKSLNLQREHSLPLAEFLGLENQMYLIKNRQGAYLFSLGKYEESKKIYEDIYSNSESLENQYTLFTNLGINYLKLGQSNKYIDLQLRALNQEEINYKSLLKIYRNLFIYYTSVRDINSAMTYIEMAKGVANNKADTVELALIDSYLGTFYWTTYKDHNLALQHLNDAEQILSPDKNYDTYSDLISEKGNILLELDSLESAQSIFQEARDLALSKSDTPKYIDALVNLTVIDIKKGLFDAASQNLEEIRLYPLDDIDFRLLTKYYTVNANYHSRTGNQRAAIEELSPVLTQIVDRAKNNTDSQQGYWSVEDEYLDAFELMVRLYIDDQQPEKALLLLDQLKTINDASLYNSPLVKAAKLSEAELAEEKRLNEKLQSLRKRYLNADQEQRFTIKTEIDRTSALREQILSEVNLNRERSLPPVWSIQRSIQPNELLLHFTEIGSKLYVTHLTQEDINIRVYDFSKDNQERFNHIADELASGRTNLNQLYELYQQLELHNIPKRIETVSVVPDNYLYRIPLEVLPTEKPSSAFSFGSSRYLIEDFSFRYFTSLQEFEDNRRSFNKPTEYDFSGFAISDFKDFENTDLPSLPFATVENSNINTALTSFSNKQMFNGDEATKEVFKNRVGSSRLVHVATHSEVSEKDPLFSVIYLKNSSPLDTLDSDKALYAYELFDTPLNSEFIMLNSCSSGSGNYMQGTGVMGISRALRYAGAKSLALNLWSVNDKVASEFATDFYRYLNEGETKSEAVRKAKLNQLRSSNANPHFWGAYMLIGNPSPINKNSSDNRFLLFSLLAFTAVFVGYSAYQNVA